MKSKNISLVLGCCFASACAGRRHQRLANRTAQSAEALTAPAQNQGIYVLLSASSGNAADIEAFSTAPGTALQEWSENNGTNQQFRLTSVGSNQYTVTNVNSGLCLDR